jgi:hypothetical protein
MTDNFNFNFKPQDIFAVAKEARIPENVQAIAEESVAKTHEAYTKINAAAKDGAKVVEEVVLAAQAGAKAVAEKVIHNTTVNTEAAFDAARAIVRAKTLPEAARLQADFLQQQFSIASAQTKELLELSSKVAQQTFQTVNAAATKSFEQLKKAS